MLKHFDAYYFECFPKLDGRILKSLLFGNGGGDVGNKVKPIAIDHSSNSALLNLNN